MPASMARVNSRELRVALNRMTACLNTPDGRPLPAVEWVDLQLGAPAGV